MTATDDSLKDLVYAALLDETTWYYFLDRLANTMPGGKAALVMHDVAQNAGYAVLVGCDVDVSDQYNAYYAGLSPFQPPLALKQVGIGICDDELFPRDKLIQTEFFNDFLLANDMPYSAGAKIAKVGDQSFTVATLCGDPEQNRQAAGRLTALAPHLKRAFDYYRREPSSRATAELGASLFDAVDVGVIVVGDDRRIRIVSEAGEAMLANASPVRISREGRVRFRKEDIHRVFERMLARDYEGPKVADFASHQTKLTFIQVTKDSASLLFEGPTVIVLMEEPDRQPRSFDPQLLSAAYELSRGETRALSGIVAGKSVDQIAKDASLSRETIRSQMKSLYAKTGATSLADVLRLAHRRYLA